MTFVLVALSAFTACVVQSVTGFGAGIVMMQFFPLFLPMLKATGLSSLITALLSLFIAVSYLKKLDKKLLILPAIFYFAASTVAINIAAAIDTSMLSMLFGIALIIFAFYFMFASGKIKIKVNALTTGICSLLGGFASGLFGIGGPPMVVYFLAASNEDKEKYLANINFFFFIMGMYTTSVRIFKGIITLEILPLVVVGIIGCYIGKWVGLKIVDKINIELMKKFIYIFLAIAGFITLFKNI